ncbi:gliding motility-associated C-terminal domain-containing protein [Lewinella sp. LCG006]|uniref:T9SS type B sorting domain-containing protein n=1 Tax=Lewinella sp. LCG006 TaxID=3231911 RepID=UPI0034613045
MKHFLLSLCYFCFLSQNILQAQDPLWTCDGSLIIVTGGDFYRSYTQPEDEEIVLDRLPLPNFGRVDCIGYRRIDNCIYGIDNNLPGLPRIFRLSPFGEFEILDTIENVVGFLVSGTISFDDDHLLLPHGNNIISIDLTDFEAAPSFIPVLPALPPGFGDIAMNPKDGRLHGYYHDLSEFWNIDPETGNIEDGYSFASNTEFIGINSIGFIGNEILVGLTSAETTPVMGFYHPYTNQYFEVASEIASVETWQYIDGCTCQDFDLYVSQSMQEDSLFQCTARKSVIKVVNRSITQSWGNLTLTDTFPSGVVIEEILYNPYPGEISGIGTNILRIDNFDPPFGIDSIILGLIITESAATGMQQVQATLSGITDTPAHPEGLVRSDDPKTYEYADDPTSFYILSRDNLPNVETNFNLCPDSLLVLNPLGDQFPDGFTFQWMDGLTTPTREVNNPGIYHLTVSDDCESREFDIVVEEVDLTTNLGEDINITIGNSIELEAATNNSQPITSYSWFLNDSLFISCLEDCASLTLTPEQSLLVTVSVMDTEGCVAEDELQITVEFPFFAPNAFSPNRDGVNDYFYLQTKVPLKLTNFSVFDRWGGLVFEHTNSYTNTPSAGWDGSSKGQQTAVGIYLWQAIFDINGKNYTMSGDVTLIR